MHRFRPHHTGAPGLIALAATLALCLPLHAQAPDSLRPDTVYRIEPIAIRAVRPSTTAGGVSAVVMRMDSVRFRTAPLLEDVLRALPLVQVRANSRGEAQLAIRGADERQVAILLDGVPLTLGWDHRTDLSVVPVTGAQRIQLIRGLSSVLHGPNVLGGAVEVEMAAPDVHAPPIRASVGVEDNGGYAFAAQTGGALDAGAGTLALRAGMGRRWRPGIASPAGATAVYPALSADELRVNSDLSHTDGFLSARYGGASGPWVAGTASAFTAVRGVPPELHEAGPRLWRYPELWRAVGILSAGTGGIESSLGTADIRFSAGVDRGAMRIDGFALPAQPERATLPSDSFFSTLDEREVDDDLTVTTRLLAEQRLGSGTAVRAAITYADIQHDEVISTSLAGGDPAREAGGYRQRLWSAGTEVDLPFSLGESSALSGGRMSAGVVLDGGDTPRTGGAGPGLAVREWGGRIGVSVGSRGGAVLLHAAASRRGRFPALREMYSTALGKFEPNPGLQPEILTAIEGGFTARVGPYDVQAVGFHQRLADAIVRGAAPAGSSARYMRVNRDQVRSTGLEILAGYAHRRFALETELTLQDVRAIAAGGRAVRAEYEPEVAAGIGGTAPLPAGLELGAELEYRGQQYCVAPYPGEENYVALDPDTRVDVQLARTFRLPRSGRHLGMELAVDNVADSAVYDQCGLPQAGRTLRLQLRVN